MICSQPASVSLSTTFSMSPGARNWPFFTLTQRPVPAAAASRAVCLQRNAGIWRTSATSAAAEPRRVVAPRKTGDRGAARAVRLPIARLEHERQTALGGERLELGGDGEAELGALHDAGTD